MKRVLHLVRFDALAMRVPLMCWAAVLVLEGVHFYLGPSHTSLATEIARTASQRGLGILRMAGTVILTAMFVHGDPTVGSTAFWRSRPIPRGTLMAAKVLSVTLWLVLLPGLVATLTFVVLGLSLSLAALGGLMTVGGQAVVALAALVAAVVTTSLLQFIIAMLGAMAIAMVVNTLLPPSYVKPGFGVFVINGALRSVVPLPLFVLAACAIAYQYLTLRLRHTLAGIVCLVIIASVGPRLISYTWEPRTFRVPPPAADTVIGLGQAAIDVDPATQRTEFNTIGESDRGKSISFEITQTNVPPDVVLQAIAAEADVELPDGTHVAWTSRTGYLNALHMNADQRSPTMAEQPFRSMGVALGGVEFAFSTGDFVVTPRWVLARLPENTYRTFEGQPVRLKCTVTLVASRYRAAAAMPLKAGNRMPEGTGVLSVDAVETGPYGPVFRLRRTYVTVDGYWGGRFWDGFGGYVLRNASRRQALRSDQRYRESLSYDFYNQRAVMSDSYTLGVAGRRMPDTRAVIDANWLAGAELVRLELETLGSLKRTITIDRFILGGTPRK